MVVLIYKRQIPREFANQILDVASNRPNIPLKIAKRIAVLIYNNWHIKRALLMLLQTKGGKH